MYADELLNSGCVKRSESIHAPKTTWISRSDSVQRRTLLHELRTKSTPPCSVGSSAVSGKLARRDAEDLSGLGCDLARVVEILETAGSELRAMRDSRKVRVIREKVDGPVSTADLIIQIHIVEGLKNLFPDIPAVGEEDSAGWQEVVATAVERGRYLWIIDPLDGTSSYLSGSKAYGIQLALVHGERIVAGWIHCPSLGWTVFGWNGKEKIELHGVGLNSRSVPLSLELVRAVIASGDFAHTHRRRIDDLRPVLASVRGTRSCAVDYIELMSGRQDVLIYRRTLPWDHAPGVYLATRANALVSRYDGSPYQLRNVHGGITVLRSPELHAYRDLFLPPTP